MKADFKLYLMELFIYALVLLAILLTAGQGSATSYIPIAYSGSLKYDGSSGSSNDYTQYTVVASYTMSKNYQGYMNIHFRSYAWTWGLNNYGGCSDSGNAGDCAPNVELRINGSVGLSCVGSCGDYSGSEYGGNYSVTILENQTIQVAVKPQCGYLSYCSTILTAHVDEFYLAFDCQGGDCINYPIQNEITFSNTSDYNNTISSSPSNQSFYINTWINNTNWATADHNYFNLYTFYPNGDQDTINFIELHNQFEQNWLQLGSHRDYGNYTYKIIDSNNNILATGTILIYNASNPNQTTNPACTEHCNPIPPGTPCPGGGLCGNPYYESASMFFSTDIPGLNQITSAYFNTSAYLHFSHPNGDYTNYAYYISFLKPDNSVFYNMTVPSSENGYASWNIPCCIAGTWHFDFVKKKISDNSTMVLGTTSLYLTQVSAPANLSVLSGYVRDPSLNPIYGATVDAVKGYTLTATTDTFGHYIIPDMFNGNYTVTASKTGYNSSTANVTINNGSISTQNFVLGCSGICPTPVPTGTSIETPIGPTPTAPSPPSNDDLGTWFWQDLFVWTFVMAIIVCVSLFDEK